MDRGPLVGTYGVNDFSGKLKAKGSSVPTEYRMQLVEGGSGPK